MRRTLPDIWLGLALALGLALVAFVAGGGTDLGSNTWVEIAVTIVGVGLGIAAFVLSPGTPASGATAVLLFAALAVFTAASIAWSVQPANSWVEANRTVSYLAAFGGGLALVRIAPRRWTAVVGALAVLATVVSGYALLAKVFPGSLDQGDPVGRLRLPFDYWNAVGLIAAMGVPACLWAGSRREGTRVSRALAVPALGLLVVTILLSLSRGALIVAAVGLVFWFAFVSVRLRAVAVLAVGAVGGGGASAWALSDGSLIHDNIAPAARTAAGHHFGLVLIAMLVVLSVAGAVLALVSERVTLPDRTRRRIGTALLVLASLIPIGGVAAVAASSRGLTGTVSHVWNQLTSPNSTGAAPVPGRFLSLGSSRGRYWNEAFRVGEHALLKGSGAGGFATAGTHYMVVFQNVPHAHSYVLETFADLGLIGLVLSLALLVAWGVAARRAVWLGGARATALGGAPAVGRDGVLAAPDGLVAERDGVLAAPDGLVAERDGLLTLLAIVIVYGVNSAIDWVWFIPGTTVTALVCAGWLAGRGPLSEPLVKARSPRLTPAVLGTAIGAAAVTLLAAWMIFQPLRSANADAAAITALTSGNGQAAVADAHAAATDDPVSIDPLLELAAIYQGAGNNAAALEEFQKAVSLQPDNPQTWIAEGNFILARGRADIAYADFEHALTLDLGSAQIASMINQAGGQIRRAEARSRSSAHR